MGRGGCILLSLLGLAMWLWLGYFNIWWPVRSGTPFLYALLSPAALGPIALVPLSLVQLWKFIAAERKENILNPHFILTASQSTIGRGVRVLMCLFFFGAGLWGLLGHSWSSNGLNSPLMSAAFIAIGTYGAVFALFSPRIRLRLSPDGFEYSQMKPARIPWHDITDVKRRSFFTGSWIVLTLKDTTEFRPANILARWRKVSKVSVYPLVLGIDPAVLEQGIALRRNVFTF
jgi:hypothetical protein